MTRGKRAFLGSGIGLVGLSALAAAVVPKTRWEALEMEVASNHVVNWLRGGNGQLVATGNLPPDQSYKPLLPTPRFSGGASPPLEPPVGSGQLAGQWSVTFHVYASKESYDGPACYASYSNGDTEDSYEKGSITISPLGDISGASQSEHFQAINFFKDENEPQVRFENIDPGKYTAVRSRQAPLGPDHGVATGTATEKETWSITVSGNSLIGERISSLVSGVIDIDNGYVRVHSFVVTPTPCEYLTLTGQRITP